METLSDQSSFRESLTFNSSDTQVSLEKFQNDNVTIDSIETELKFKETMRNIPMLNNSITNPMMLEIINELNKYLSLKYKISEDLVDFETVGNGSFGEVCIVYDKKQRIFMVKKSILPRESRLEFKAICFNELKILIELIRLDNPKLLKIYKINYLPQAKLEIYMERGIGTLEDLTTFKNQKSLECKNLVQDLRDEITSQLEILAEKNISHLDIKPANIIITNGLKFKLADFGCSKILSDVKRENLINIVGTPEFMSQKMRTAFKMNESTCLLCTYDSDIESLDLVLKSFSQKLENNLISIDKRDLELEFSNHMIFTVYNKSDQDQQTKITRMMLENNILAELYIKLESQLKTIKSDPNYTPEREFQTIVSMASIKLGLHEYSQSREFFMEAIKIGLAIWDPESLEMEEVYEKLGRACTHALLYSEAREFLEKSLKIKLRAYGEKSFRYANNLLNLGVCFVFQSKYEDAFKNLNKSLEIIKELSEKETSLTAEIYTFIARNYSLMKDWENCFKFFEKSVEVRRNLGIENEPENVECFRHMGNSYLFNKKISKAIECFEKAIEIRTKLFGHKDSSVAKLYNLIGKAYRDEKNLEKALEYYKLALDIRLQIFKPDDNEVIASYYSLGCIYRLMKKYDSAIEYNQKGIDIRIKHQQEIHPDVGALYNELGLVYEALKQNEIAIENFKKSLRVRKQIGKEIDIISVYGNLGSAYFIQGDYYKAIKKLSKAMKGIHKMNAGHLYYKYKKILDKSIVKISTDSKKKIDIKIAMKFLLLKVLFCEDMS